jgi:hypothetical protein
MQEVRSIIEPATTYIIKDVVTMTQGSSRNLLQQQLLQGIFLRGCIKCLLLIHSLLIHFGSSALRTDRRTSSTTAPVMSHSIPTTYPWKPVNNVDCTHIIGHNKTPR